MATLSGPIKWALASLAVGLVLLLGALLLGSGGAFKASGASISGTAWSDPQAPANTYAFEKDGTCEVQYKDRTYAGSWTQNGDKVEFNVSGDYGATVFHMTLLNDRMTGDAIPPGGNGSLLMSLVRTQAP